jgi:hypothetical protein
VRAEIIGQPGRVEVNNRRASCILRNKTDARFAFSKCVTSYRHHIIILVLLVFLLPAVTVVTAVQAVKVWLLFRFNLLLASSYPTYKYISSRFRASHKPS